MCVRLLLQATLFSTERLSGSVGHVLVGGVMGLLLLAVIYRFEKDTVMFVTDFYRSRTIKKTE